MILDVLSKTGINWNDFGVLSKTGSIGMILEY